MLRSIMDRVAAQMLADQLNRSRLAIAEFLAVDAAIERLVFSRAEHTEIERAGVAGGMVTMLDSGLDAALAGTTTIDEVLLSVRAEA